MRGLRMIVKAELDLDEWDMTALQEIHLKRPELTLNEVLEMCVCLGMGEL